MTTKRLQEFRTAFVVWREQPIAETTENTFLAHASSALVSVQTDVAPTMVELYKKGVPLPLPLQHWNMGMNYLLVREIKTLRGHLRLGRDQVATRALIEDALRLQRAWDAYDRVVRIDV